MPRCLLWIALSAAILAPCAPSCRGDERSELILERAASFTRKIRSIEFRAFRDHELSAVALAGAPVDASKIPNRLKSDYTFYSDGSLYRVDERPHDVEPETFAFNGEHYQYLGQWNRTYTRVSERPDAPQASFVHPIAFAYYWLLVTEADSSFAFHGLRDPEKWSSAAASSKYIGSSQLDGRPVEQVEVQRTVRSGNRFAFVVSFAPDLDYLPVHWTSYTLPGRELFASARVLQLHAIATPEDETFSLPVTIASDFPETVGKREYYIDPSTLRVNHQIDEDFFTLSPVGAEIVDDLDARPAPAPVPGAAASSPNRVWMLVVVNLLAVFVFAALWWYRKRRNSQKS